MKPSKIFSEFFIKYKHKAGIKTFDQQLFLEALEDVQVLEQFYEKNNNNKNKL